MTKQLKIRSYSDLLAAIRARREELDVPHMVIDDLAGLQEGYTSKVLSPTPRRFIGPISWNMIEALGLGVVLIKDAAALRRSQQNHRWQTRKRKKPPGGWGHRRPSENAAPG